MEDLKQAGGVFGIKFLNIGFIRVGGNRFIDWRRNIQEDLDKNGKPQILITYIKQRNLYVQLKEYLYRDVGVPHQNILAMSLQKKNRTSVLSKILIQMSAKISAQVWQVTRPEGIKGHTMLVGIDIYHKRIQKRRSCIGVVATMNTNLSQYWSRILIAEPGQAQVDGLSEIMKECI